MWKCRLQNVGIFQASQCKVDKFRDTLVRVHRSPVTFRLLTQRRKNSTNSENCLLANSQLFLNLSSLKRVEEQWWCIEATNPYNQCWLVISFHLQVGGFVSFNFKAFQSALHSIHHWITVMNVNTDPSARVCREMALVAGVVLWIPSRSRATTAAPRMQRSKSNETYSLFQEWSIISQKAIQFTYVLTLILRKD